MREIRKSGSEGGGTETNRSFLPLSLRDVDQPARPWPGRPAVGRNGDRQAIARVPLLVVVDHRQVAVAQEQCFDSRAQVRKRGRGDVGPREAAVGGIAPQNPAARIAVAEEGGNLAVRE